MYTYVREVLICTIRRRAGNLCTSLVPRRGKWCDGISPIHEERDNSPVEPSLLHIPNSLLTIHRYPPIYTFLTTGIAGCVTTFSSWMLEGYLSFSNFDHYNRKGLHDVSHRPNAAMGIDVTNNYASRLSTVLHILSQLLPSP